MPEVEQRNRAKFPLQASAEYFKRQNDPRYFFHREQFLQPPLLNASVGIAANTNWEIIGTNAANADSTLTSANGLNLRTAGADEDQIILSPHLDAKQSALAVGWNTAKEPYMSIDLYTGAAIDNSMIWAGFRDTDSSGEVGSAVIGDAADQFMLYYDTEGAASTTQWCGVTSRAGTDVETLLLKEADKSTSGITLEASTLYRIEMWLNADRIPQLYINDKKMTVPSTDTTTLAAMGSVVDIKPYVAMQGLEAADDKGFFIRNLAVSKLNG